MTPQAKIKAKLKELAGAADLAISVTRRKDDFCANLVGDYETCRRLLHQLFPEAYITSSAADMTFRLMPAAAITDVQADMEVDPYCLTWSDATVVKLAQAIHDERAFQRLPILADALEEAGCINAALLEHCRAGTPHFHSCWVVDLLLGLAKGRRSGLRKISSS